MMKQRTWMWIKITCLVSALLLGQRLTFGQGLTFGQEASGAGVAGQAEGEEAEYQTFLPMVITYSFAPSSGVLDLSFGEDGIVISDLNPYSDGGQAVALQPDGKLVVAGRTGTGTVYPDPLVVRYNPDGSLDTSFSEDGWSVYSIFEYGGYFTDVVLQEDGKILAVGTTITGLIPRNEPNNALFLIRYNPDGSYDTSFGTFGIVVTKVDEKSTSGNRILLQPDGKIVVAGTAIETGYSNYNSFALVRYNADGSLDSSFDGDGMLRINLSRGTSEVARTSVLQEDGKIVVAGDSYDQGYDFALARFNPDGSLDTSFDGDGWLITDFYGADDAANAVLLQPDGKIVVGGFGWNQAGGDDFLVARLNLDGSLDTSFDGDGWLTTDFYGDYDVAKAVLLQPDGKIVAAGVTYISGYPDWDSVIALARYNRDGSLDTSFGVNGLVTTDYVTLSETCEEIALQPDGKIVAVGGGDDTILLARYK